MEYKRSGRVVSAVLAGLGLMMLLLLAYASARPIAIECDGKLCRPSAAVQHALAAHGPPCTTCIGIAP